MIIKMKHKDVELTINAEVKCFFEDELPLGCPLLPTVNVEIKEICIYKTDILDILNKKFVENIESAIKDAYSREIVNRMHIQS